MKKIFIIIAMFFSISLLSQNYENSQSALSICQKDYLYGLSKLNIGTILQFKATNSSDTTKLSLIKEKLNIDFKVEGFENIPFTIQEKCDFFAIQVNVFFILLKDSSEFETKYGSGEFFPNKVTLTYKWVLKNNILIFIFTGRELTDKLQRYVYLPNS
jgi:hypothetical protein